MFKLLTHIIATYSSCPIEIYHLAYPTQFQFTVACLKVLLSAHIYLSPTCIPRNRRSVSEPQFNHHCFADDIQAYVDVPQSQVKTVASQIQNCLEDVAHWSGARRLQLNPGKTNIMWFGLSTLLQCISPSITTVVVDQQTIASTEKVRNLGVNLDSDMDMHAHNAKTAQTCFYHLRRLRQTDSCWGVMWPAQLSRRSLFPE